MKSNGYGTTAKFTALLFCLGKKKQNREQIRKTISQLEDVFEKFTLFQSILALSYIFEPNMAKNKFQVQKIHFYFHTFLVFIHSLIPTFKLLIGWLTTADQLQLTIS
jgi:hypothetical protein